MVIEDQVLIGNAFGLKFHFITFGNRLEFLRRERKKTRISFYRDQPNSMTENLILNKHIIFIFKQYIKNSPECTTNSDTNRSFQLQLSEPKYTSNALKYYFKKLTSASKTRRRALAIGASMWIKSKLSSILSSDSTIDFTLIFRRYSFNSDGSANSASYV